MELSTQELARASGVTARTLRYYDEIDLLVPSRVAASGYRYYDQVAVLRLQEILLYRELGLGLDTIAAVIDEGGDAVDALRRHHDALLDERDRLTRLARVAAETIETIQKGDDVSALGLFPPMTPERADYLAGIPKKRTVTGILLTDDQGRTLLVKPAYKSNWQLPGCIVAADESPRAATARAVQERLGLALTPGRLLVVDWMPPSADRIEGVSFIYDGPSEMATSDSDRIILPKTFEDWAWCTDDEMAQRLPSHLLRRTRAAVIARAEEHARDLEDGVPV